MADEVVAGTEQTAEATPAEAAPVAQAETTAVETTPEAPTVPDWVNTIDQPPAPPVSPGLPVPQPMYPPVQAPVPFMGNRQVGVPPPDQIPLDKIAEDPRLIPNFVTQAVQTGQAQMAAPLYQMMQQMQWRQVQQEAYAAQQIGKQTLASYAKTDASLSNPKIGPNVQKAYQWLNQRAAMGDPQAAASLRLPILPQIIVAAAKAEANLQAPSPVVYEGAATASAKGTAATKPARSLTNDEDTLRRSWGMTVEEWLANEKAGE